MSQGTNVENGYTAAEAIELAEQWRAGFLPGGDETLVIFALLDEVKRLKVQLHDLFAAGALQGICATLTRDRIEDIFNDIQGGNIEAKAALAIADAVLEARK